jgi:hypothetical protein
MNYKKEIEEFVIEGFRNVCPAIKLNENKPFVLENKNKNFRWCCKKYAAITV